MEDVYYLEAYTSSQVLAKDVCFAMARAYGTSDIRITEIKGYGWHIDCECATESCANLVKNMLGKKAKMVNWLS